MQKKLRIAICEDEDKDAMLLAEMIKSNNLLCDIAGFSDAESLLAEPDLPRYDLFFLDIYLSGMSGVELARHIREKNNDCELVFTTVSDAHALEGFEVGALQYLVKPLNAQKVTETLNRFIKIRDISDMNYCTVVVDRTDVKILYRNIRYISAYDKYCKIHTTKGIIETYTTMAKMQEKLPNPPFLRCHRSYTVNMDYIKELKSDFVMKNGDIVLISRSERGKIKDVFMKYLVDKNRSKMYEKRS